MSDKTSSRHEPWLLGGVAFILLWLPLTVAWPGLLGAQPADPLVEAQAHLRAGKAEEALIIYDHMVEAQPQNLEAHKGRANALGRLGRYADALEEYARVVASKPEDVEAHIGRARILGWMGRYSEAEAECRRVLTDNPNVVEAYLQLGTILGWQRKYSEAAELFERARQLAPHDPESFVGLARLRFWQDDLEGAKTFYDAALRLDPSSVDAREGLDRIAKIPRPWRFRTYVGFRFDALNGGLSDWYQETIAVSARPWKETTFLLNVDQYRRFDQDATQLTIGAAHELPAGFTLGGSFTYGFDADIVARKIYVVDLGYRLASTITPLIRYRHASFGAGVREDVVSPGVEVTWSPYVAVLGRYYYADVSTTGTNHAGFGRVTLFPEGSVSAYGSFGYGGDVLNANQVALREITVTTAGAGVTWRLTDRVALRLDYEYEDRRTSYIRNGVNFGISMDF
ncbi:MAG TPA: tetratricopeptide repeat protein [Bryobacteraceae bacterium]|nr:tetratricopeptide repeat protein [Bryobacteraceae bacterium]